MEKLFALALAAALVAIILLCGCAQQGGQTGGAPNASAPEGAYSPSFILPQSPVPYTAHYAVSDSKGGQSEKTVWRTGDKMRVRLGAQGAGVDVFFLGAKAYSCPATPASTSCFEITGKLQNLNPAELSPAPPKGRSPDETTDIGGTSGSCYVDFIPPASTRKRCFTNLGVLAYDEYNATQAQTHVEYLIDLLYSASESDFALPAAPQQAPG